MNKLKVYALKYLPVPIAHSIIYVGKAIKKSARDLRRYQLGNGQFAKEINILGVNFTIYINPTTNGGVDENIARFGYWEKELGQQFLNNICKGDIFLDIGANIGYHSLFVSRILENTGSVHAFEPIPRLCEQMSKSIEENKFTNIRVYNFGLAESEKETQIFLRQENTGGSSIIDLADGDGYVAEGTVLIKLKKFDDFWNNSQRVAALKIDIEGYELEALRGASQMLMRDRPIIFIEFSPKIYIKDYPEKPADLVVFLRSFGYTFFRLDGSAIDLDEWMALPGHLQSQIDLMCKVI